MILDSRGDDDLKEVNPNKQLELLKEQCNKLAPAVFHAHGLYLEILRSIILNSVRNAILNLITAKGKDHLFSISKEKSKTFQMLVDTIVGTCNSLLTVENLIDLAKQIEIEDEILIENAKNQMSTENNSKKISNLEYSESQLPQENILLETTPPIANPSLIDDWFCSDEMKVNRVFEEGIVEYQYSLDENSLPDKNNQTNINSKRDGLGGNTLKDQEGNRKLDLLSSLFSLAKEAFNGNINKELNVENESELTQDKSNLKRKELGIDFPDDPQSLADWINTFDLALTRRLRNLSHALNIELLRVGLLTSIVPENVLEAVLLGQISDQFSESNLLRISVPMSPPVFSEGVDVICLLIRTSELEFDNIQLRNCRVELKKYQKKISLMSRQYRYWKSRSLANDMHQNWWQNPSEVSPTNTPKN